MSEQSRRGQALVEFAFVLPLIVFLIVMTLDFGRMMAIYVSLANGVREGSRIASLDNTTDAEIRQAVYNLSVVGSSTQVTICRNPGNPCGNPERTTKVTATYKFQPILLWGGGLLGIPGKLPVFDLTATAIGYRERPA